ncbi:hypothetical protein [Dethiothermospora halolimnae]
MFKDREKAYARAITKKMRTLDFLVKKYETYIIDKYKLLLYDEFRK